MCAIATKSLMDSKQDLETSKKKEFDVERIRKKIRETFGKNNFMEYHSKKEPLFIIGKLRITITGNEARMRVYDDEHFPLEYHKPSGDISRTEKGYDPVNDVNTWYSASIEIDDSDVKSVYKKAKERIYRNLKEISLEYLNINRNELGEIILFPKKTVHKDDIYYPDDIESILEYIEYYKNVSEEMANVKELFRLEEKKWLEWFKSTPEYKEFEELKEKMYHSDELFQIYQKNKEKEIELKIINKERDNIYEELIERVERDFTFDGDDDIYVRPEIDEDKNKVIQYYKGPKICDEMETREIKTRWRCTDKDKLDYRKEPKSMILKTGIYQHYFEKLRNKSERQFLVKKVNGKITLNQIPNTIEHIDDALEYVKNYDVKTAEEQGKDVIEFGDYFIIEMKQREISTSDMEDDNYIITKTENGAVIEHDFYGTLELDDVRYKPVKKKSAGRKERLKIKRYKYDREKYKKKYIPDIDEKTRRYIKDREEELIELDPNRYYYHLTEPVIDENLNKVIFKKPESYVSRTIVAFEWLDRLDADENYLLVSAGWKRYWYDRIWGAQNRKFLLGKEDGHVWLHQVQSDCNSIEESLDYMKPAEIKKAEKDGRKVKRQGDFYFKEMKRSSNMSALEDSEHVAFRTENGWKIKHPQHKTLNFKGKWKAVQNITASRPGLRGQRLAD